MRNPLNSRGRNRLSKRLSARPASLAARVASALVALAVVIAGCSIPTTEEAIIADGGIPFSEAASQPTDGASGSQPRGTDASGEAEDEGVDASAGEDATGVAPSNAPFDTFGLDYSGPGLSSHWHAAYAVRVCNDVFDPFTSSDDPLGIHSHGDGLIHIHPFFSEAAWDDATLGHFTDAMGIELEDGYLSIPGSGEWRDGDMCNGEPARLSIKRWAHPTATEPWEEVTESIRNTRFLHDGESFTISFAPEGITPVRPPAADLLTEVSPSLGDEPSEPFVLLPDDPTTASIWVVAGINEPPCTTGQVPGRSMLDAQFCYTQGSWELTADGITSAKAMWVNRGPGVVLELDDSTRRRLNTIIEPHTNAGGIRVAVQVDDAVVISIALLRPVGDSRFAFVGGMTPDQARTLARLFGSV